jgi:putative peptide zinc metalloprotease protein
VIAEVLVRAGQRVTKGTPLFRLDNPDLVHDLEQATARLAQAKAVADVAAAGSPTDRLVAERRADEARAELERVQAQVDGLMVLARSDGVVVMTGAVDSQMLVGRYVDRGALLGMVEQLDALTIRAILSDREHAHVFRGLPAGTSVRASARLRGQAGRVVPLTIAREGVAGSQQGVPLALTTQGGGDVLLDPNDTSGMTTITPQFVLEMAPESQEAVAQSWRPGLRAVVRFATPATPLASQWYRRLRQYLSEKATA